MMGERQGSQDRLFYEFDLEAMVPADHLLRQIDAVLDLSELRDRLAPHYSHTGRPSIDPELMIRMLLIGYCYGIRSERQLCEEVKLNLAYRWFCQLGIEDQVPDHSSFSKNRHGRFRDADILRHVFETTVQSCMKAGLVEGEGFAVDASVMRADANRQNHVKRDDADNHDWTDGPGADGPSCLVPGSDGISLCYDPSWRKGLWDKFYTSAPRLSTQSEKQYSDRRLRSRS